MGLAFGNAPDNECADPLEVLTDCHRRLEYFLDVLLQTAASGDALTPRQWTTVERALAYLDSAALQHAADEGESLFPQIRASVTAAAAWLLDVLSDLQEEQYNIDAHHRIITRLGRRWLDHGRLSRTDTRDLIDRVEDLQSIYRKHAATEERILFPYVAYLLSPGQWRTIANDMAARRAGSRSTSP